MGRRWAIGLAVGLLLVGGIAFFALGLRALTLERETALGEVRERARRTLDAALGHAQRVAREPRTPAAAAWRLISDATVSPEAARLSPDQALLLREASYLERVRVDPPAALGVLARLATDARGRDAGAIAAVRGASLARRGGDHDEARRWLARSGLPRRALVDEDGVPLRLTWLYQQALLDLDGGRGEALAAFLEEVEDGALLSMDAPFGPDALVLALAAHREDRARDARRHPLEPRLAAARARVARGRRLLAAASRDRLTLHERLLLRRTADALETRPPSALLAGLVLAEGGRADVRPLEDLLPANALHARLAAPLAGLRVVVQPTPPPEARGALVALVLGLGVYAVGCLLALLAIRRSLRAARMQADFVAEVSHELKTPIASVRAMAELLAEGGGDDPRRVQDYARRIEGEMQRLGATVRNVLDVARIERHGSIPVVLEPGDPALLVERVGDAFRPTLEARGFEFLVRADPAGAPLQLDAGALQGVLMNLIDNAAKFSPAKRAIELEGTAEAEHYAIEVRDRGRGIGDADPERLFGQFERADRSRRDAVPGVGLGLFVARQVVAAHRGRLRAAARPGGGSVFRVELPRAEPPVGPEIASA